MGYFKAGDSVCDVWVGLFAAANHICSTLCFENCLFLLCSSSMLSLLLTFCSTIPLFYLHISDPSVILCSKTHYVPTLSNQLTSFDADVGAADLARLVFGSAEVVVVVDVAVVGGGREGVKLQGAIGVHMADVGHVVDVVAGGQVPA